MAQDRQRLLVDSLRRLVRRGARGNLQRILTKARSEDLAEALNELMDREAREVYRLLLDEPARAAEVASEYDHARLPALWKDLTATQLKPVFEELASDDAADILPQLDADLRAEILELLEDVESEDLEELMQYGEDTAGGIMSTDFFSLDKELTAREAIVGLQDNPEAEGVFYLYCVNEEGTLVGVVSLRQLLLVRPSTQLKNIMNSDVISVPVTEDQEEVARIVARYNLLGLPVIDEFNKLVGIVTVDDVIDVLRDEATEDMLLMAGVADEDIVNSSTSHAVKTRLPWLLAAVGGGLGAALLIGRFEHQLESAAILASFIPIVMGLGGNVGVQASTIVVRGMAMGQLDPSKFASALVSETKVVAVIATVCASLAAAASMVMGDFDPNLAGAVGSSLVVVMTFGALLGTAVPMLSHRFGIDPAVATGPILTTSIDLIGVLLYFLISAAWLGL
jgi:magnesium transporter